ncbi:MAG: pyrroloquinoline quinone biosynthesis protein PqqB [Acetobacteraceae bacterium]|nr:pyrroloquinoline quinone biosynthesis protein PqqB [Acetobacteraceae bacterium]
MVGSAAGGGLPQWNCACRLCRLARAGDPSVEPRSEACVAVSADHQHWLLVGASPDLRQQVSENPVLHPAGDGRGSPIFGVLLISADIDGIGGLLVLREQQPLQIFAPRAILQVLEDNSVFGVLDPTIVKRIVVRESQPFDCGFGLTSTLLPMPGKVPLYAEDPLAAEPASGEAYAALVEHEGRSILIAPACAEITQSVRETLDGGDIVLFDGTFFTDHEMIESGLGKKSSRRMGHIAIDGPDGSLSRLADLPGRRIYFHINNTNPILLNDSPERRRVEAAGFEVAYDGMELRL